MGISNYQLCHHFRPRKGWMNDPNGLVYFQGYYHAFFQHSPDYEWGKGPMVWGHARTKDFMNWEELPIALRADSAYDGNGCWSGTALEKDGILYLFYTSVLENNVQQISVAYSSDGIVFKKYANNPVIAQCPLDGAMDFRDPAVMEKDGRFHMTVASGDRENQTAYLLHYYSEDLLNWQYCGVLRAWQGYAFCECPSMRKIDDKILLGAYLVCPNLKDFVYVLSVGTFENGRLAVETESRFNIGPDAYSGQIFTDPKGRHIALFWIPGWEYMGFAEKSLGCLSLPMEIQYKNGKISVYPILEAQGLLRDSDACVTIERDGLRIKREQKPDVVYKGKIEQIQTLRDGYVIEVFINHGEAVIAAVLC